MPALLSGNRVLPKSDSVNGRDLRSHANLDRGLIERSQGLAQLRVQTILLRQLVAVRVEAA